MKKFGLVALMILAFCGCGKHDSGLLNEVYDLEGVALSSDLQPAISAGLEALKAQPVTGSAAEDLASYFRILPMIEHAETRHAGGEELFRCWRAEPDNFLWMQLASNNKHLLRKSFDYQKMYDNPALSDTSTTAGAYLQGLRYYGRNSNENAFLRAEPHLAELSPLDQIWLVRKLALALRKDGQHLPAARRLLELLPVTSASVGNGAAASIWRDITTTLMQDDRLDDAFHAAVMSIAMARDVADSYQEVLGEMALLRVLIERKEYSRVEEQLDKCMRLAGEKDYVFLSISCGSLGATYMGVVNEVPTALRYDRDRLEVARAAADSLNVIYALVDVSYDFKLLGQLDSCKVYIDKAQAWIELSDDPRPARDFPFFAATYYVHIGDYAVADSLLQVGMGSMDKGALLSERTRFLLQQIQTSIEMGQVDFAYRSVAELSRLGDNLHDALPDQNLVADLEIATADLTMRQGEYRLSAAALQRAWHAVDMRGGEGKVWDYHRSAGELALLRGAVDSARVDFEKCLVLATERKDPARLAESRFLLGTALLESGHAAEARSLFRTDQVEGGFGKRYRTVLSEALFTAIAFSREGLHREAILAYRQTLQHYTLHTPADIQARLRLEMGRSLLAVGRIAEAEENLLLARNLLVESDDDKAVRDFRLTNRYIWQELTESLVGLYFDHPELLATNDSGRATLELAAALQREKREGRVANGQFALPDIAASEPWLVFLVGEQRSFRWLAAEGTVTISELPGRADLRGLVAPVVADQARPGRPVSSLALQELAATLLGSLTDHWSPGATLYLTADSFLRNIPWAALPILPTGSGQNSVAVVEYGPICEKPLSGLSKSKSKPNAVNSTMRLLAMGNDRVMSDRGQGEQLPTLHHAQAEIARIAASWTGGSVETRVGEEAFWTESAALDLLAFDVIHIATHTQVYSGLPGKSTIRLAAGGASAPLSIDSIAALKLNAELVFLSCCESARGVSTNGGLDSFAGACLQAGAGAVIASTQRIDDEAAAEFAVLFYSHWLAGKSKAEALRAAQLELRAARETWQHPYYWASYRLIGDGS